MSFKWIEIKSLAITCKTRRITLTSDLLLFSNFSTKGRFIVRPVEWRFGGRFIPTLRYGATYVCIILYCTAWKRRRPSRRKPRVRGRSPPWLCRSLLVVVGYPAIECDDDKTPYNPIQAHIIFIYSARLVRKTIYTISGT